MRRITVLDLIDAPKRYHCPGALLKDLKPWEAVGVSRATWYRRHRKPRAAFDHAKAVDRLVKLAKQREANSRFKLRHAGTSTSNLG